MYETRRRYLKIRRQEDKLLQQLQLRSSSNLDDDTRGSVERNRRSRTLSEEDTTAENGQKGRLRPNQEKLDDWGQFQEQQQQPRSQSQPIALVDTSSWENPRKLGTTTEGGGI